MQLLKNIITQKKDIVQDILFSFMLTSVTSYHLLRDLVKLLQLFLPE
jgi:hypothetical protein